MKFRLLLPLLTLLALLSVPAMATAEEVAVKSECTKGEECSKCTKGEKCSKCAKGEKCPKCKKSGKCPFAGLKCPVTGKDIVRDVTAVHHGGKIFFCCEKCLSAWNQDAKADGEKKFIAQANYQLVASEQAKQKGCPMSGKATKDSTVIEVGVNKAKVAFCCSHCQEKAEAKEGGDQISMLFNQKAFANAFEMVKKEKKESTVQ